MNINHLDLFSGIGGFALGLKQAGFKVKKHYFSEVDKHAIANYKYNFKEAEYVGSVTDVRGRELERPTIITFGSPCQDFSLAGKRKGLEGHRSGLILEAIRLISETRPDVFIWENVKGTFSSNEGRDFQAILREFTNIGGYRLEWQLLNTSWLLPQNRERIYLIGHLGNRGGRNVFPFGEDDCVFDKSIRSGGRQSQTQHCSTIVRPGMGSKADDTFIATTLNGSSAKMVASDTYIKVKSATNQGFEEATEGDSINLSQPNSETRRGRVGKGKAQTLETSCNQGVIQINPSIESGGKQPYQQNRMYDKDGIKKGRETMTPAQEAAMQQIKELRFSVRKQDQWDEARTAEKMEQQPHMAMILDEQLEYRKANRQNQIKVLYNLLDESLGLSDFEAGIFLAFDSNCPVQDLLNPTDQELEQLNAEQIITIQLAKAWLGYFPQLTYRQAVVLAMVEGNPHVEFLLATNPVAIDPNRPKTIKIKRGYRSIGLKTQAA